MNGKLRTFYYQVFLKGTERSGGPGGGGGLSVERRGRTDDEGRQERTEMRAQRKGS